MQVIPLDLYEDLEQLDPKTRNVILKLLKFMGEIVKREDFLRLEAQVEKLANSISELAEAQKKTDQRISELAEAQKKTEEEVKTLSKTVVKLLEAQQKTDEDVKTLFKTVSELSKSVAELVEAQKRTDQRISELAEAQKRTDQRISELAEAQKRTDQRISELAEAQKRTDQRISELAEAQKKTDQKISELAEAQKRSDQRISELVEAQKRTDQKISELVEAQKRTEEEVRILAQEVRRTREEMGGLSLSFSYALENEAYRKLPDFLKRFGIEVMERLIRTEIGGKEINFFGKAKKDGKTVFIVGEAKIRLDDTKRRRDVFKEIEEKIAAVKKEYGDEEIVPLLVTHFATKSMLKKAKEKGILVVQSFEW